MLSGFPIESGIVPGVANTQQMEQIVPRSPTNEESVGNYFMPWSKILKIPKLFGRSHHPRAHHCRCHLDRSQSLFFFVPGWLDQEMLVKSNKSFPG